MIKIAIGRNDTLIGYSPQHAILQVVEQINQSFEKKEFTLGEFVDLSKAFDTVDHQILLKKLVKL